MVCSADSAWSACRRWPGSDPFGVGTRSLFWDDGTDSVENALKRCRAAFEIFTKLGVQYYCFHDRDVSPEGATLEETNANLDKVSDELLRLQKETGVKLLWGTANMFSHPRFQNGASTNPDAHVVAHAAAQVKKAMEVTKKLGGENYVFWGGREGYMCHLNTDVRRELDHMGAFFKAVVAYKKKIGFDGQLLIEPKPREPTKHQYDYDAQTVIGFLKHYGLDQDFKLNIEPNHTTLAGHDFEHDVWVASKFGMLGSIDSNTGDTLLGWDTDQFITDVKQATLMMKVVLEQGGLAPGGLNFDCKVRRESSDMEDLFISHVQAMDVLAHGLLNAAKILEAGELPKMVSDRYASFDSGIGKKFEDGEATLEDLAAYAATNGYPEQRSGKQELYESVLQRYID